jgi:hypothetical protein
VQFPVPRCCCDGHLPCVCLWACVRLHGDTHGVLCVVATCACAHVPVHTARPRHVQHHHNVLSAHMHAASTSARPAHAIAIPNKQNATVLHSTRACLSRHRTPRNAHDSRPKTPCCPGSAQSQRQTPRRRWRSWAPCCCCCCCYAAATLLRCRGRNRRRNGRVCAATAAAAAAAAAAGMRVLCCALPVALLLPLLLPPDPMTRRTPSVGHWHCLAGGCWVKGRPPPAVLRATPSSACAHAMVPRWDSATPSQSP